MSLRPEHEAFLTAGIVTALVTLVSVVVPAHWIASAVGGVFFGATWLLVFRRSDAIVEQSGLAFGGLVLPARLDPHRIAGDLKVALGWAFLLALVCFGPFYVGFRLYARFIWHLHPITTAHPWAGLHVGSTLNEVLGQVALIALPEEAFYRGYLQTRLDEAWTGRVRIFGAPVGGSILVTSAIFAIGHLLTIHDAGRLAVFFPSLLFGWLRAKTGGVGASIAFHASCNLFSATLLQAYGSH